MSKQAISRFWPKSATPADFYRPGKSKTAILEKNAEISAADFRPDMAGKLKQNFFLESRQTYLSEKYILLGVILYPKKDMPPKQNVTGFSMTLPWLLLKKKKKVIKIINKNSHQTSSN